MSSRFRHMRWVIIALIFFATLINFLDRQTVSVLSPVIREKLKLSNTQYSEIIICFLVAYTISQGLSGRMFDWIGNKRGFIVSIVIWSTAAIAHAFARGFWSLSICRAVLGLGEAGNWPGAAKVVAEWFPVRERAFAMGIFNSGPSIGSMLAPPLIIWLQLQFGWQAAFTVTGVLGFLWLIVWALVYQPLATHPWVSEEERTLIGDGQGAAPAVKLRWWDVIGYRQTWATVASRFFVDPVWWLYIVWLPEYLNKARGLDLKQIALSAWLPFLTADIGSLLGGFVSGFLIRRGWSVDRARKTVIVAAAGFMMAGIPAAYAQTTGEVLVWISCVTFGFQAWINNVQTIPSDVFPPTAVASVMGLGGTAAGIGVIIFTLTTGWVVDHFSFTPILITAAVLAPVGTIVLLAIVGRIEPAQQPFRGFPVQI